jgi:hypothetical protein
MKILHRISVSVNRSIKSKLSEFGITVGDGFQSFEIDESAPVWNELSKLIVEWQAVDMIYTKYTATELRNAPYLRIIPSWHWEYPQPEDNFEYLSTTYDLTSFYTSSGIGKKQKAPFNIRGEPRWGKKHILQLNWVFDEFFTMPEIWKDVFRPFGIEALPVMDIRTGAELKTITQLKSQGQAKSKLQLEGYPFEVCEESKKRKYQPVSRGFFPKLIKECDKHYFFSQEYFGSGADAHKAVLISNSLYMQIKKHKLKGISFEPVES